MNPPDRLTAAYVLAQDTDKEIRDAARKTLREFARPALIEALEEKLDPLVLKKVAEMNPLDEEVLTKIAFNDNADEKTLEIIALSAAEATERGVVSTPAVIPAPGENSDAQKPRPVAVEKPFAAGRRPGGSEAEIEEDRLSTAKRIMNMTVGEKIKLSLQGNKEAREILIKDSNKIVSITVLKNPHVTEDEVVKLTASTGTSDELLRMVARNREWLNNRQVRLNLVGNPKTPLRMSLKLVQELHEKELIKVARSKNVHSILASTARKVLELKKKH
ncbi:MAG: hypothetical protein HY890_09310 [Deltaproteobacteria bacterium]|nr:hypothetical protein [Deltaproteobacteria bacterium]